MTINGESLKKLKIELDNLKEYQCGDHPTRILYISNITSKDIQYIKQILQKNGTIKSFFTKHVESHGFLLASFFDLREAKQAHKFLREKYQTHYALAKDVLNDIEQNQGTLVVFNIEFSVTNNDLKELFGQYGDIKEIRETPNKKHHKFIEYFDLRDAQKALNELNQVELKGRKLKIEPSRPGGIRQRILISCAKELGLDDTLIGLPPPIEMSKLITKVLKGKGFSFSSPYYYSSSSLSSITYDSISSHLLSNSSSKIQSKSSPTTPTKSQPIQSLLKSSTLPKIIDTNSEDHDITINVPKPTIIGQELSKQYEKERVGTPHMTPEKKITLFSQIERKGIGFDELEDIDEMKKVFIIENIPDSFTYHELIAKIENCISCFYDQFFILKQSTNYYKCIVRVTNQMVIDTFKLTFNNVFLDNDQDDLCRVKEILCQGNDFTKSLSSLLL